MLQRARLPLSAAVTRDRVARSARRLTWRLAFATTAALVAAFLLTRWEVSRRLADVQQRRADISGEVRRAINTRAEMEAAADVATVLAEREAHASRASAAAAAIALALPQSASLTVLSISGDSVLIEGESPQSAEVYAALRHVPTLERIQAAAPLRQERQADSVIGRFAFSARLRASPTAQGSTP
jgi:Tfp pilus assembly protein PilN